VNKLKKALTMVSPLAGAIRVADEGLSGLSDTLLGTVNPIARELAKRDAKSDKEDRLKRMQAAAQEELQEELMARRRDDQKPMMMSGGGMTPRKRPIDGKATRGKTKGRIR
jgi:hypothetical protein